LQILGFFLATHEDSKESVLNLRLQLLRRILPHEGTLYVVIIIMTITIIITVTITTTATATAYVR